MFPCQQRFSSSLFMAAWCSVAWMDHDFLIWSFPQGYLHSCHFLIVHKWGLVNILVWTTLQKKKKSEVPRGEVVEWKNECVITWCTWWDCCKKDLPIWSGISSVLCYSLPPQLLSAYPSGHRVNLAFKAHLPELHSGWSFEVFGLSPQTLCDQ